MPGANLRAESWPELAQAAATELGLEFIDLAAVAVPALLLQRVPRPLASSREVLPLALDTGGVRVAMANPWDVETIDELAQLLGGRVRVVVAAPADLRRAIARVYPADSAASLAPSDADFPGAPSAPVEVRAAGEGDAPIIRLVHDIVRDALQRRASDIHLEPLERRFRLRYRIDGRLLEVNGPPQSAQLPLVSRLKLLAQLSIAEKRLPQDGRFQIACSGRQIDLRASVIPTVHGESVVLRILEREGLKLGLPQLGLGPDHEAEFRRLLAAPDGIVLVTGPTGSGKTTTLYGCLQHLSQQPRKIITVEDPIEYQLTGINQVPVRPEVGLTFAAALRAMLRQAPNVVMVGEIRDRETADIALNASITGHLVLSTLHTNDAAGAVTRLIDLGAKPFLVAAGLRAVAAQRLVRRVCQACRVESEPSERELLALGADRGAFAGRLLFRGAGCARCHGTGYHGRTGIFEIFLISDAARTLIHDRASLARLRRSAREAGMRTLRQDGLRKVLAGATTIDEVVSVTLGDID